MMKKIKIIQGTHWDYEWYFTNNQGRVLANFNIKEILKAFKDNKVQYFILDGQTSFVEEYIQDNPEDKEFLASLILAGKIVIGPWYSQSDQMIIAGESIVKNLQTGIASANNIAKSWDIGYIPDAFGQSQDLPKILNGFNISNAIFWRGKKGNEREFIFKAIDGSSVNVYNIKEGYYYGEGIFFQDQQNLITKIQELFSQSKFNEIMLSVSSDQRCIDLDIKEKIIELNNKYSDYHFESGKYEDIFKNYNNVNLSTYSGELLDSQDSKIHRSIYSNRYDLKYLNNKLEQKIINNLEPLLVLTSSLNIETFEHLVQSIWKNVLKNSAHDGAGGCNSDQTNQNIKERFIESEELLDSYVNHLTRKISETIGKNNDITIFNTIPYVRNDLCKFKVFTNKKNFSLFDKENNEIEYYVLNQEHVYSGSIKRNESENEKDKYYYSTEIFLNIKMQPLSYEMISLVEDCSSNKIVTKAKNKNIENSYLKISIENNKVNLLDKINDYELIDFLEIVADADDGDSYDWSPLKNSKREKLIIKEETIKTFNFDNYASIVFEMEKIIPKNLQEFSEDKKSLTQKFYVSLFLDNKWLNIKLKTKNESTDIRWRIVLNSKINYQESIADTPFSFIKRPLLQKELNTWEKLNWREEPTGIYPLISNLIAKDENHQMNIILNGIKEYELKPNGQVELTLFRSTSFLGKPDLVRRPGKASGQEFKYVPTNGTKLHQELNFNFNLTFDKLSFGSLKKANLLKNNDLIYYQNQKLDRFVGPLQYFSSNKLDLTLPKEKQIIKENNISSDLVISIIKQVEKSIILRIYNPNENNVDKSGEIIFMDNYAIYETDLLEKDKKIINSKKTDTLILPDFRSGEIKTFILEKK